MKLVLDGVEVPWPKLIEVFVDFPGETVGPLLIEHHGGVLTICGKDYGIMLRNEGRLKPDGSYQEPFLVIAQDDGIGIAGPRCIWDGKKWVAEAEDIQPDVVTDQQEL